ncbi:MAG: methyltransferase domain-containing protein [Alphaproteobacteria bacterium]|nr:methyltransferase domain-containing protein [Alphaproteobacteria bacterium]
MTEFTFDVLAGPGGFGDGLHPSTATMLDVLRELAEEGSFANVLDMGCGSGVLSMAAASLWPACTVLAVDMQESAVETALHNISENGFDGRIHVVNGNSYRDKNVVFHSKYDLILANMTADVHAGLAAQITDVLADDGLIVLSGVLRWREEDIIALHEQQGLQLIAEPIRAEGGWSTLLLAREA